MIRDDENTLATALVTKRCPDAAGILLALGLIEAPVDSSKRRRYRTQPCGTRAGYQRHKDRGGKPCEACVEANNAYMRRYLAERYTPDKRRAKYERDKARGYYERAS